MQNKQNQYSYNKNRLEKIKQPC